jgi:hypothetical protein
MRGTSLLPDDLMAAVEELTQDRSVVRMYIPFRYGELRHIAMEVYARMQFLLGRTEPVILKGSIAPLKGEQLEAIRRRAGLPTSYLGPIASFTELREQGLLQLIDEVFDRRDFDLGIDPDRRSSPRERAEMRPDSCVMCKGLVPWLRGQAVSYDSLYVMGESPPLDSCGDWHVSCLRTYAKRAAWGDVWARVTQHYQPLVQTERWTARRDGNHGEVLAFSRDGELLGLRSPVGRLRRVKGGSVFGDIIEQFHLELDDEELIEEMQASLAATRTFPVLALFERMGLVDRVVHPEALEGALFHWRRGLANMWTRHVVVARCEYGVFVPAELEKYVVRTKGPRR